MDQFIKDKFDPVFDLGCYDLFLRGSLSEINFDPLLTKERFSRFSEWTRITFDPLAQCQKIYSSDRVDQN